MKTFNLELDASTIERLERLRVIYSFQVKDPEPIHVRETMVILGMYPLVQAVRGKQSLETPLPVMEGATSTEKVNLDNLTAQRVGVLQARCWPDHTMEQVLAGLVVLGIERQGG